MLTSVYVYLHIEYVNKCIKHGAVPLKYRESLFLFWVGGICFNDLFCESQAIKRMVSEGIRNNFVIFLTGDVVSKGLLFLVSLHRPT